MSEKTAAISEEARRYVADADMRMRIVDDAVDHFRRRWRPLDPEEREQFERDLVALVIRIHQASADAAGAAFGRHCGMLSPLFPPVIIPGKR